MKYLLLLVSCLLFITGFAQESKSNFDYLDVFALKWVSNPQISPNGKWIVYERNGFDIMKDKQIATLWLMDSKGDKHVKLTGRDQDESGAVWSYDGKKIAFKSSTKNGTEIYVYDVHHGRSSQISQLEFTPQGITWSPDGKSLAFTMFVPSSAPELGEMPTPPAGADWGPPARITTRLNHESDGSGYIENGFSHIFTIGVEGGLVRQLTSDEFQYKGQLSWGKYSKRIYFSANRSPNADHLRMDTNIFSIHVNSKKITQLSAMNGPSYAPIVSPNGRYIAYLGYEDKVRSYQLTRLYVMKIDGSGKEVWMQDLDRSVYNIKWRDDSKTIFFAYDDNGATKIAKVSNAGRREDICIGVGGVSVGRPYASGSFSVSKKNDIAFTLSRSSNPAELATVGSRGKKIKQLTNFNDDLLSHRNMAEVEQVWYKSSVDGRQIQGWFMLPPDYDSTQHYPLLVENHGGPILHYGKHFSAEFQLYAAKGYIVFYPNPRGSTSYGEEFADLLYHNYPSDDYQDVMDGVDFLIEKGIAHEESLYVTGGSAGGTMTAWIVGKNNRFKAAVVHKPVVNWISKTLVADNYYDYANYRYPGQAWENWEAYWNFSPISLVANIETPTMVMVGLQDLRTPPSEAKQLYHALKLRKIETMLIEIPDASHSIAKKPSNLISKVVYTVGWCDRFRLQ